MSCDISTSHILDRLELAIHLADASKRNSGSSVEITVLDKDVGRVCLWRNCIVTIVHGPPAEGNVVGIDCVTTIGILQDAKLVAHSLAIRE